MGKKASHQKWSDHGGKRQRDKTCQENDKALKTIEINRTQHSDQNISAILKTAKYLGKRLKLPPARIERATFRLRSECSTTKLKGLYASSRSVTNIQSSQIVERRKGRGNPGDSCISLKGGFRYLSNPGPLAPEARIIPLDQFPEMDIEIFQAIWIQIFVRVTDSADYYRNNNFTFCHVP